MYVCIYIYMYIYIYIYMYTHLSLALSLSLYIYIHISTMHTCICASMYICIYAAGPRATVGGTYLFVLFLVMLCYSFIILLYVIVSYL